MVLAHHHYQLPREGELVERIELATSRGGLWLAMRYLSVVHDSVALPVWGTDHGELRLTAGDPYPARARCYSGVVGLVYAPRGPARAELGPASDAQIAAALRTEVELLDRWGSGQVYGYIIERLCLEHTDNGCCGFGRWVSQDSCGGFESVAEALHQGRAAAG